MTDEGVKGSSDGGTPLADLNPEQVQVLLHMINTDAKTIDRMSGKCYSSSWIIDTGASYHVTSNEKYLTDSRNVSNWNVGCLMVSVLRQH